MTDLVAPRHEHRDGTFAGAGGLPLYYQAWMPPDSQRKKAVLINLHGLGDHSGLYPTLANHFPAHGIALYAYDMRGNGRSPGQRAYLRGWHEYRGDLHAFLERVRKWEGDLPVFILGNSLGGLVVLDYALHYPAGLQRRDRGSAASGRGRCAPVPHGPGARHVADLAPIFSRGGNGPLGSGPRSGCGRHHPGRPTVSPAGDRQALHRGHRRHPAGAGPGLKPFPFPCSILHGSADRMVPPEGSRRFFSRLHQTDRELREYPGAYHGLFADLGHEEVLKDTERWIEGPMPAERP